MKKLYDVQCDNLFCDEFANPKEVLVKDVTKVTCEECSHTMKRVYTKTPTFNLKGEGFYKEGTF